MLNPKTYNQIPSTGALKLVAGPFAPAVSTIWAGARAVEYLTANDKRRHVWHACLSSEYCPFSPERGGIELIYSRLTYGKSRDLIAQAYACRPKGVLGVLGRFGSPARPPQI